MKQIDVLPDDVLLGIFNFHVNMYPTYTKRAMAWHSLVHVCRRWRSLVFGSPRHLNLRLLCTPKTPVKDTLDIWPALPLTVAGDMASSSSMDNVIAALGQSSRVSEVYLEGLAGWHLEKVLAAMSRPFPELIDLMFFSYGEMLPIIPVPDSFLGGSAPRLQSFSLYGIPCPRLPKLALFATHLVHLVLFRIPHSGHISPEAMAALLSVLSSLQSLTLVFELESPQSHPDWETRPPPPPKRSILPALYKVQFDGVTEYLEDLVIFIDAPQLSTLNITLSHQADFDIPRLARFINRTPKLRKRDVAHVQFDYTSVGILFGTQISIYCRGPGRLLLSAAQVCNSSSLSSTVEDLYIGHQRINIRNQIGRMMPLRTPHGWNSYFHLSQ